MARIAKHDVVFILGSRSYMNQNQEIRLALASLRKFCVSWLRNVYIIGDNPHVEGVIYIPDVDPYNHDKDANIIHKTRTACERVPDLSDDFLLCCDDIMVTRKSDWSDFAPRYKRIYDPENPYWQQLRNSPTVTWDRWMVQTLERFGAGAKFWQPHIWSPINKGRFLDMCRTYDYAHEHGITIFTLYYNFIGEEGVPNFDHYMFRDAGPIPEGIRHISYNDRAFADVMFQEELRRIVS